MIRLLSFVLLVACTPKVAPVNTASLATAGHPDLHCPATAEPRGLAPPDGVEVYCVQMPAPSSDPTVVVEIRHGPSITWYANGQRESQGTYLNNLQHGPWSEWYANGQLHRTTRYVNGVADGPWIEYYDDGQERSNGAMGAGEPDGYWVYYKESGVIDREGMWANGNRNGPWVHYNAVGQPAARKLYRDGRLISQVEF